MRLLLREKSKKGAEQAAAVVCLRVLRLPEGRLGEEDSGLVGKRKRAATALLNGSTATAAAPQEEPEVEQEANKKIHLSDREETAVSNGNRHQPHTP